MVNIACCFHLCSFQGKSTWAMTYSPLVKDNTYTPETVLNETLYCIFSLHQTLISEGLFPLYNIAKTLRWKMSFLSILFNHWNYIRLAPSAQRPEKRNTSLICSLLQVDWINEINEIIQLDATVDNRFNLICYFL